MIAIAFRLLAGRYHATGWDHHVNEGTVEWPPSPWRVLRALAAASYRCASVDREGVGRLLGRLSALPRYFLPPVGTSHLRHYMPTKGEATTKVFDAFVAANGKDAEIVATWPALELADDERRLLEELLPHVAYLGRAESWTEAKLLDHPPEREPDAWPLGDDEDAPRRARLLALRDPRDHVAWCEGYLAALDPKVRRKVSLPATTWEILSVDTEALQREGWSAVPGTRWVRYGLRESQLAPRSTPAPARERPNLARFVLDSAVFPRIERCVAVGEKLRAALLSRLGDESVAPSLVGKDADKNPLKGHQHAFFLPESDDDGRIRRISVYAPGGFEPDAVEALRSLRALYNLTSKPAFTTLVALRRVEGAPGPADLPDFGASREWVSLTPFIPPRFPKRRGGRWVDTPDEQVRRLCCELLGGRGEHVEPTEVEVVIEEERARDFRTFLRTREGKDGPARPAPCSFRVIFPRALHGPLIVGHGAHFGLGRFVPSSTS